MSFYKDKRFYIPLIVVLCFEFLLQMGIYSPLLKKNSYAANVKRITNHVLDKQSVHDPDILILGTSVAYQGLSVKILNQKLQSKGYKVQSVAIPGSEVIVQHIISEKILDKMKKVKLVIHINEVTTPWVQQKEFMLPTLAMISEFGHHQVLPKIFQYKYNYKIDDLGYVLIKSIAYRRDMRDFILDFPERMKYLSRKYRNPNNEIADYENSTLESISMYNISFGDIEGCIKKTTLTNNESIPTGSNLFHKKAIFDTCELSKNTTSESKKTEATNAYFHRLKLMYDLYKSKNIQILNVLAPYSNIVTKLGGQERITLWKSELTKLNQNQTHIIDLQEILKDKNDGEYFFDVIHMNQRGMIEFSNVLGDYLNQNIEKILK